MKAFALAVALLLQIPAAPRLQHGAMTGQIRAEKNKVADKVRVFAIEANSPVKEEDAAVIAIGQTDKDGRFHLDAVPAGRYFLAAGLLDAPTYYPGVAKLADAKAVDLAPGEARAALDFALDPATLDMIAEIRDLPQDPQAIQSTGKKVTADTKLELRQVLQVEWQTTWWAVRIIDFLPDGKVKVHYLGWNSTHDEIVPRSKLQLDDKATQKAKEANARLGLSLSAVMTPKMTEGGKVPVNAGPIESTNKPVTAGAKLKKEQVLQVKSGETWWAGQVLEVLSGDRVKIHYLGWDASNDEIVPRSRLQLDDKAIEKTRAGANLK